jgi:glycosyltransferase involved in cell wall biosynthesis
MSAARLADPLAAVERRASEAEQALAGLEHLRVAVVHEWLTSYAGSEKVVEQILRLFPRADLFALVDHLSGTDRNFLKGRPVHTSFLQNMPGSKKLFRKLLWILPHAIEAFDLSAYDLVITSSHAVAKGVLTGPHQIHICYCHSPIRYAWDFQHEYLRQSGLGSGLGSLYARLVLHYLRLWDVRTANGVDLFVANSHFVARRISKVYNRSALVVHPPVDVEAFQLETKKDDFYLTASRLVPYKRVDVIVNAFARMPGRQLIVVGDGPNLAPWRAAATDNVKFLGYQPDQCLHSLMSRAKAFLFAAEEDFGITVVEAQACGTPVICLGRGGVLDSVVPGKTGVFFKEQKPESLVEAIEEFESRRRNSFDPYEIRSHALSFAKSEFRKKFAELVSACWHGHLEHSAPLQRLPSILTASRIG